MASFEHLAPLSDNHELSWYLDPKNIPNQTLPNDTISFLENGPRAGFMPPLIFLNLLQKQFDYVKTHMDQGPSIVQYFNELPIQKDVLHLLLSHLLKWFGGYPVNFARREHQPTMKAIERFFLSYPGDTPEKVFAKKDMDHAHYMEKLGIALTTGYRYGVDASEILAAMPGEKKKKSTLVTLMTSLRLLYRKAPLGQSKTIFKSKSGQKLPYNSNSING